MNTKLKTCLAINNSNVLFDKNLLNNIDCNKETKIGYDDTIRIGSEGVFIDLL